MNYYEKKGFHLLYKREDEEVPKTNIFDHCRIIRLDSSCLTEPIVCDWRRVCMRQFMPILCLSNTKYIHGVNVADSLVLNGFLVIATADTVSCLHGNRIYIRKNRFGRQDTIDL